MSTDGMSTNGTIHDGRTLDDGRSSEHADDEPQVVTMTLRLEQEEKVDRSVRLLQPLADSLLADPQRRDLLLGRWLGHAVHPLMTDLPLGFWTSATVLDLLGGSAARPAARRLVGLGVVAAVPTAVTGLAEWDATGEREKRVGVVHATANSVALVLYTASYLARRRGRHLRGAGLALGGAAAAGVGGYLGGHLISARKVSSRNPVFES